MGDGTSAGFKESLKDFRVFLYYIWNHLALPDPTPIQYDIADYLQNGPKRKVIQAFRGVGKSWITSAYVLWRLYWNPQLNILVVSASKERADAFSTFTLRLINEIPWLSHLKPDKAKGQRTSKISFDVGPAQADHMSSIKSVGIYGQVTGSRADIIIADDVEVANNSYTQGMRDRLANAVKEFDAILKPGEGAEITYLGTPQTEMSLYNILGERGYSCRIWPARVPDEKKRSWYGCRLAPLISRMERTGATTDPKRFTDRDLTEREASYGRSGFALQFMLDTSLSDMERYPLRLSDLVIMSLNPELAPEKIVWAAGQENRLKELNNLGFSGDGFYAPMGVQGEWRPYQQSVMSIDPSGRGKDKTAWAIIKNQGVNLYLVSAGGHTWGYSNQGMETLYNEAKKHQVQLIKIESNFGDGMFTQLFKSFMLNRYNEDKRNKKKPFICDVEEVRSYKQKELRIIDTLEPIMNQHRLIVDRRIVEQDYNTVLQECEAAENGHQNSLFYQLTHITKDRGSLRKDDLIDALELCVAHFTELMEADQAQLIRLNEKRDWEAELALFTDSNETGLLDMVLICGSTREVVDKLGRGSGAMKGKMWVNISG